MLSLDANPLSSVTQSEQIDTTTEPNQSQNFIPANPSSDPPARIYYVGEVFVRTSSPDITFCRDLLRELANAEDGSLSLTQLSIKKAEMKPGIERFISEHWMEGLKEDYKRVSDILFYDPMTHFLVVEDPQLIFYLRRISFARLASDAGKFQQEAGQKPGLFICYSESDVLLLDNLLLGLAPMQNKIVVERCSDNEMASGARNAAYLENAIKTATFVLILVTQKFLITSGFLTDYNLPMLLNGTRDTMIIPVIAASCVYEDSGLDQFPPFNDPKKSQAEMTEIERDRFFVDLINSMRKKLRSI